nr:zinc finger protein CONSTANS-LIKE 4-like [Ipomoea batatas]
MLVFAEDGMGLRWNRLWNLDIPPKILRQLKNCRKEIEYTMDELHAASDSKTHTATLRSPGLCKQGPTSLTCKFDVAALCVTCDRDFHSANPLARYHDPLLLVPFYNSAANVKSHSWRFESQI